MLDSIFAIKETAQKEYRSWPRYAQVKNHVEMFGVNILEYTNVPARFNGIPSVMQQIQSQTNKAVTLSKDVQMWMWRLFKECIPLSDTELKRCWANTFMSSKAFTNGTGWDKIDETTGEPLYADWIMGTGLDKKGFKLQPTICHGATIKVLRPPFAKAGIMQAEYEILDVTNPEILLKTYKDNRHLIFPAINWYRYPLPHGKAEPFPYSNEHDVPIPLFGFGTDKGYIDAAWLRWLSFDEPIPANPYWSE